MGQPNPGAAGDAAPGVEVPERDLRAIHGAIAENEEIGQGGQQQDVVLPVLFQASYKALGKRSFWGGFVAFYHMRFPPVTIKYV